MELMGLRLAERKDLSEIDANVDVQIYHLERIASLLNSPQYYGVRMEFLDMEMNKEEQLAFFASQTDKMSNIENILMSLAVLRKLLRLQKNSWTKYGSIDIYR